MIPEYISSGFRAMTFWETYAAGTGYMVFLLVPVSITCILVRKSKCSGIGFKCVCNVLLPALQVMAVIMFVFTLFPVMFGLSDGVSWRLPWKIITIFPAEFIEMTGALVIMAVCYSFIPVLGRLHEIKTVIPGTAALVFAQMALDYLNPTIDLSFADLIPGVRFIAGLVIISALLSIAGRSISRLVSRSVGRSFNVTDGIGELVSLPLVSAFGFIPLFMYAGWLA